MRPFLCCVLIATILARVRTAIGATTQLRIVNRNISPDGYMRSATLANGMFPGPLIKGNKGGTFSINVNDALTDNSMDLVTSIHWHGIFQTGTNYLDGVAFVNQCPIVPNADFSYQFSTGSQAGTFWYHSHYKAQTCDGLRGPLVIYDSNDPHRFLYDVDNESTVITLADWYHSVSTKAPSVPMFDSTLINGRGRYSGGPPTPLAIVNVASRIRYRLRLVSISCEPAYDFSIDNHKMTVIEVDGVNVEPVLVDSLKIFSGQRYSVVLQANQRVGSYWIRALPNLEGQSYAGFTNVAILRYRGAPPSNPSLDPNVNVPASQQPLKETDLRPLVPTPVPGNPYPGGADININLDVTLSDDRKKFLVNGVSFEKPEVPVLLQILNGDDASKLVPTGSIYPLGRDKSVEISIPGGAAGGPHPVHLHGHAFHVVRSAGQSTYNFVNPVVRDVVSIGEKGDNVTIRFTTDNAGPWFLHCHMVWHAEKGFAVVLAEDVPGVKDWVRPTQQWNDLCPAYNNYIKGDSTGTFRRAHSLRGAKNSRTFH